MLNVAFSSFRPSEPNLIFIFAGAEVLAEAIFIDVFEAAFALSFAHQMYCDASLITSL